MRENHGLAGQDGKAPDTTPLPKNSAHSTRKKFPAKLKLPPARPGQGKTSGALKAGTRKPLARSRAIGPGRTIRTPVTAYSSSAVAVFARAIVKGETKTRLVPALGPNGAAEFHRALVSDTLGKVAKFKGNSARYVFTAGGLLPKEIVPSAFDSRRQQGSGLAQRLDRAFTQLLRHHSRVVVIGTDSPLLSARLLRLALEELRTTDAVLGPCPDGGYYLVGLRRSRPGLFNGVRMGTEFAFYDTLASLLGHGFSCSVLDPCPDIDVPADLAALKQSLTENSAARRLAPHTWRFLTNMG